MSMVQGNRVILLASVDAACNAMLDAMRTAQDHIHLEAYKIKDDTMGRQFRDLLVQKQKAGIHVNLIYDSLGCYATPARFFQVLRDAGADVVEFNPINPIQSRGAWALAHRDHSKLLIVDGRVAITGGVNIHDADSSASVEDGYGGEVAAPWRDTDVQIEGPVVAEYQTIFLNTWKSQKGAELTGTNFFPEVHAKGNDLVMAIANTQGAKHRATFIMYNSALAFASRSVHLTSSYFAPDEQTREALEAAARRGVDVRIILPGVSDHADDLSAGEYYYRDLLASGVKLYRRRSVLLHAKTGVIDGCWSTVGSSNLDYWSLLRNNEVNALILSRGFADQMERMFADDLADSDPIRLEEWDNRSLFEPFENWFAHLFSYWL